MEEIRIKRFSVFRIVEHWVYALIFLLLVITGLSQKFYYLDISEYIIFHIGGIDYVRLIHRYAGLAFAITTITHSIIAIGAIITGRWRASMIITTRDIKDAIHNIKYYMGTERYPAPCDRYNYRQKFEYWGVLMSAFIMTVTGLILWFPVFFTRFLSGEFIPASQVMHANQGIIVFIIIALWHIYNSIFSPNIFPLDRAIFTGYISRDMMLQEHPIELARIEGKSIEEILEEQRDREHHRALEQV